MGYILLEGGAEFAGEMEAPDRRAIELAGGANVPIGIIPAAAAPANDHLNAGENGVNWFRSLGATDVTALPLTDRKSADDPNVVEALRSLAPGGRLVINAIRKEDHDKEVLLSLDYAEDLWMEREIKSVANVARNDVAEFLELAAEIPILPAAQEFPLEDANVALQELKNRRIRGAKVLRLT